MFFIPTAAIIPGINSASTEALPREYEHKIISSAVKQPSAYAQPNSPTEWPMMPSGLMPIA